MTVIKKLVLKPSAQIARERIQDRTAFIKSLLSDGVSYQNAIREYDRLVKKGKK